MRQRITIEQLNELSDKQAKELRDWWYPGNVRTYDVYAVRIQYDDITRYEEQRCFNGRNDLFNDVHIGEALPYMSIGQMLQLLNDDRQSSIPIPIGQLLPNSHLIHTDSLCDALWSAVKRVLASE